MVAAAVEAEIGELEAEGLKNCASPANGKYIICLMSPLSWKRIRVRDRQLGVLACDGGGADNAVVINNTSTKLGSKSIISTAIPQTELTLNLLRQSTFNPAQSAWECFHGPFNYDAT